jgi:toxin ParE1/3/4
MARIVERPKARQELEDIAVYIALRRPSAAARFLTAARKAYETLATFPEMGSRWKAENRRFQTLRYFPIPKYPNYVIFYRPLAKGIEVVHILHAARDIRALLESEKEDEG